MKGFSKFLLAGSLVAVLAAMPTTSMADTYDTDDSDHPLRYAAHIVHAHGKFYEYFVTRPAHWVVSQPKARYIFGHVSHPRHEDYWGDFDLYQRYTY